MYKHTHACTYTYTHMYILFLQCFDLYFSPDNPPVEKTKSRINVLLSYQGKPSSLPPYFHLSSTLPADYPQHTPQPPKEPFQSSSGGCHVHMNSGRAVFPFRWPLAESTTGRPSICRAYRNHHGGSSSYPSVPLAPG